MNGFFSSHRMLALDADTWRKYALALGVWLNFLVQRGVGWDHAVAEDVEAFKYWRMTDVTNPRRVAPGTVKGNLIALNVFYTWAAREHGVTSPIVLRHIQRSADARHRNVGVVAASPAGARCRDLKWFTPAGYVRWRDLGLRGFGLDGLEDPAWRGRNEQRDAAFADGLFETGLRVSEWASILDVELPPNDSERAYSTCWLADACAKGGWGRRFWLPYRALTKVLSYMEGGRALAVRRAQHAGRYDRLPGVRVVEAVHANRRVQLRDLDGARGSVPLDALGPGERLRLFRDGECGLEPVAVWLNEDGLPRAAHGWQHTFEAANRRVARLGLAGFGCSPHRLRHSFALRWYSVGKLLYDVRFAHLDGDELRDFRVQFGDTWQLVQTLLGHRSVTTTMDIYLEPFKHLDVELLKQDNGRLRAVNAEAQTLIQRYAHIINELDTELDRVTAERDQLLGNVRPITTAPSHPGHRADSPD